jgi:hypothetical protein
MNIEKAKVHYISTGQNHIARNKDVITLNYKDFDIYILDEEKLNYPCLLYKDQVGEYWMFYYASIAFERFNSLLNNECNEYDKESYTNYCDYILEKVRPIHDNLTGFFKEKIDNSKYFNCIELAYLEKYYPELYSDAQKSREQFLKTKEEQRLKEECEEKERKKNKVKEKNQILKDKVQNMKESIVTGKVVLSEVLNFYKDEDYEKETYQNNFLYLLKEYGIEVPLKTQGYINNKLHSFNFGEGNYRMYGNYSCQTLFKYFDKLKEEVLKENEKCIEKDLELEL